MKNQEVMEFLKAQKGEIASRFAVRRIGLFGSHVRGEATEQSDVDILVEMDQPTFDGYMDLKFYLEERLGRPVDLVLTESVKPRLRPIISREVAYA
ncbi:MAG: nucleotidyltransferase [Chloroflexota bacterium]|nr:MAG: nucleotidyltransferase [Chloroflexota bacterium]